MARSINKQILLKLWDNSVSLAQGTLFFADKQEVTKLEKLNEKSALKAMSEEIQANQSKDLPFMDALGKGIQRANSIIQPRASQEESMKKRLKERLLSGQLIALGFEPPRNTNSAVTIIPIKNWVGKIDWAYSSLEYQSLKFIEVRVLEATKLMEASETHTPDVTVIAKPTGRPSLEKNIKSAINSLIEEGQISKKHSMAYHFPIIRKRIYLENPHLPLSEKKPANPTIIKYFSKIFSALDF